MRTPAAGLLLSLMLVASALAEEPTPRLVPPPADPDRLELLPLPEHRFVAFSFEHRDLFERMERLHWRYEELTERIREEGGSDWLLTKRMAVAAEAVEAVAALREALEGYGVEETAVDRALAAPDGPDRNGRLARAQVLTLPGLDARRRALFERLVYVVEGTVRALHAQRDALLDGADERAIPEAVRERIDASADERTWHLDHRFWRVVDYVLDADAKRALRARLPVHWHGWEGPLEIASHLGGISVGQLARIRALEREIEAEGAADQGLAEALERKAHDESLPEAEQEALWKQREEIHRRHVALHGRSLDRLRRILSASQWAALEAVPPRVGVGALLASPDELFAAVEVTTDEQALALLEVHVDYARLEADHHRAMEALEEKASDYGPDSPQMDGMEMEEGNAEGGFMAKARPLIGRVFLEVMTPDQVVDWVLGGEEDD